MEITKNFRHKSACCGRVTKPAPLNQGPGTVACVCRGVGPRGGEGECRAELRAHKAQNIQEREHNIRFTGIPVLKDVTSGLTREKVFQCLSL
jgi:hypothetical protein